MASRTASPDDRTTNAPGCHDFAVSADPVDPERVNVYERSASPAALQAFRGDGPGDELGDRWSASRSRSTRCGRGLRHSVTPPAAGRRRCRPASGRSAKNRSSAAGSTASRPPCCARRPRARPAQGAAVTAARPRRPAHGPGGRWPSDAELPDDHNILAHPAGQASRSAPGSPMGSSLAAPGGQRNSPPRPPVAWLDIRRCGRPWRPVAAAPAGDRAERTARLPGAVRARFWEDLTPTRARGVIPSVDERTTHRRTRGRTRLMMGSLGRVVNNSSGGDGTLLAEVLRGRGCAPGTVLDHPSAAARSAVETKCTETRRTSWPGSFFRPAPPGWLLSALGVLREKRHALAILGRYALGRTRRSCRP